MNKILIIVLVIIGLVGLFFLVSTPSENAQSEEKITMNTVNSDIENGSLLLDVRTEEEFSDGYIDGAINLPLDDIKSNKFPNVSKDKPLYVYCRSGNRSAEASKILEDAGYINVIDLGGVEDVVAIGGVTIN
jgi:rhodanese-related sulfurtransferase